MELEKQRKRMFGICAAMMLLVLAGISAHAQEDAFGFDDIRFWVGSGSNRAAMVIEWDVPDLPKTTLAWGYRWDGDATGEDMIRAISAADKRLFVNFEDWPNSPYGTTIYGMGYDRDKDGFTYVPGTGGDLHNSNGDGYAKDKEDVYSEGWQTHFWSYWTGSSGMEKWGYANKGMTSRTLSDGDWDGWRFNEYDAMNPNNISPDLSLLKAAEPGSQAGGDGNGESGGDGSGGGGCFLSALFAEDA